MTERVYTGPTIVQVEGFWIITWDGRTCFDVYPTVDEAIARVAEWWMGH